MVVSGDFARKAERFKMRVTLGSARPGDLVELAAALGDGHHTYTLTAITPGSLLLLPIEALHQAFESYPPLRMRLLEELAREVSRAYITCCLSRVTPARRHRDGRGTQLRSLASLGTPELFALETGGCCLAAWGVRYTLTV